MSYEIITPDRAASFSMGQATSPQVRTTASYRIQLEAAWQGTNISIPVCGAFPLPLQSRGKGLWRRLHLE